MNKFKLKNMPEHEITAAQLSKLRNNPRILALLANHQLTEQDLKQYYQVLTTWVIGMEECDRCPGLHACVKPVTGYFYDLDLSDLQVPILTPCRYLKQKQAAEAHLENYVVRDFPDTLIDKQFNQIDLNKETDQYVINLEKLSNYDFNAQPAFYLSGPVGVGKTYLAACLANKVAKTGHSVAFIHVPTFASRMRNMALDSESVMAEINLLSRCFFLVLDDIGAESVSVWLRDEVLLPILNYRMEAQKATVFTSNFSINQLTEYYTSSKTGNDETINAKRIIERIKLLAQEIKLTGPSRRQLS